MGARKPQADREQGRVHALPAFGHGLVGQSDNGEKRRSGRDLSLDGDEPGFDADEGDGGNGAEHGEFAPRTRHCPERTGKISIIENV